MYKQLILKAPKMVKCFFAFSRQQFEEGKKKAGILDGEKLFDANQGLYGTNDGLTNFFKFYEDLEKEIVEKCDPQEVYDYEFWNHESEYVGNDHEAIKIVVDYFGKDVAKTVNRKYGYLNIDDYAKK